MKPATCLGRILAVTLFAALATPGCATTDTATAHDIEGLRQEVRALRAEIQELKKASVMTEGLKIQLPSSSSEASLDPSLVLSILKDGKLVLGSQAVSMEELEQRLKKLATENPQTRIVIRADSTIAHQQVVDVMSLAKSAGIQQLAIAAQK